MPSVLRAVENVGGNGLLRTPPHNPECERALIGAILLNNKAFDLVADFLLPDHFSDPVNAVIFSASGKLINAGRAANPVTMRTHLEHDELVKEAGGMKYLAGLTNSMVTVVNARDYGRVIYDLFLRRELINLGEDMVNAAFAGDMDECAADQIEIAANRLSSLTADGGEHKSMTLHDAVQSTIARWDKHDKGEIAGVSSGLDELDRELGLMEDGDLIILAGAPAMGKSALSMTIAYNAAQQFKDEAGDKKPKRVLVFSAEMSVEELASRAMTTYTTIQGPRRRKHALKEADWSKLMNWAQEIAGLPLVLDDRGAPTLGYIQSRARQEQRKGGVGLVVVDFLQIMGADPGRRYDGRTDEVGWLARGLKTLARTVGCPVICLSSINRKVEDRDNKRPHMADLRQSGDIEFAADAVAFCFREEYYLERDEPPAENKDHGVWEMRMTKCKGVAEVIIAKSRHGTTGTARLHFERERTLFSDHAPSSGKPNMSDDWRLL